jgi:hypothetical protein
MSGTLSESLLQCTRTRNRRRVVSVSLLTYCNLNLQQKLITTQTDTPQTSSTPHSRKSLRQLLQNLSTHLTLLSQTRKIIECGPLQLIRINHPENIKWCRFVNTGTSFFTHHLLSRTQITVPCEKKQPASSRSPWRKQFAHVQWTANGIQLRPKP